MDYAEKERNSDLQIGNNSLLAEIIDLKGQQEEERKRISYLQSSNTALKASNKDIGRRLSKEKKRNGDIQIGNNTLQAEIIDLQRQQEEYKKQLKTEKDVNVKLKEALAEMYQAVDHMRKVQNDLEEIVDKQKRRVSLFLDDEPMNEMYRTIVSDACTEL